jgi:hypothetical protein
MSNYEDIYGKRVKELSADPTLNSSYEGQVWYNSTEGVLKSVVNFASFSAGANLIKARRSNSGINAGTLTAGICFGGQTNGLTSNVTDTEEYNGTGWSAGGAANTARGNLAGTGTQTAALWAAGNTGGPPIAGSLSGNVEEYNGSTWTEVNNVSTARADHAGAGPQTAAFISGGVISTSTITTSTEEYDGTNWTGGGAIPAAREYFSGTGDSTNGLLCGGAPPSFRNTTFLYDGSSWTNGPNLNTGVQAHKTIGAVDDALRIGGVIPSRTTTVENYDGTSWSTFPASIATGRDSCIGAGGTSSAGFIAGGATPSTSSITEELVKSINTITAAAFSAGGTMGTARSRGTGGGTTNAGIFANGQNVNVEEYNGTSWSEQNNMPTSLRDPSGFGTQTAFVGCAGYNPGPGNIAATHEYDGTNWTTTGNMNTARASAAPIAAGITTAGLVAQNDQSPYKTVESYNGSTWTTESSVANGRSRGNMTGTESAAFLVNGYGVDPASPQPGVSTTTTENYNGSTWTAGTSSLQGTLASLGMANGNQDNTTIAGGFDQHPAFVRLSTVQNYNGTSWITQPSMGTARYAGTGGGTPSGGFVAGGSAPSGATGATEELEPETTAVTAQTLTSS